jgi:hypothetical protein
LCNKEKKESDEIKNLKSLKFGRYYQTLGDSLDTLTKLEILSFKFNKPFGDSLKNLISLKTFTSI